LFLFAGLFGFVASHRQAGVSQLVAASGPESGAPEWYRNRRAMARAFLTVDRHLNALACGPVEVSAAAGVRLI
jgi:hypothetical protein